MAIFLRDLGLPTPEDETLVTFHMSQFTEFLLKVDGFMLTPCRRSCSIRSLVASCQAIPPSKRIDLISRWLYPVVVLGNLAIFYALLLTIVYERIAPV
uniref:Uncharacterized protein n=1 Tax=Pyrodinium bahamense TaxID=73915 RepID=A0A7S0AQI8_9DINO